jgi:hypothetical protein
VEGGLKINGRCDCRSPCKTSYTEKEIIELPMILQISVDNFDTQGNFVQVNGNMPIL